MSSNESSDASQGGEVSEVSGMDPALADTPIQPDQATQGGPDTEVQTDAVAGHRAKQDGDRTSKDEGLRVKRPDKG